MPEKIASAVVLSYARVANLPRIVEGLLAVPWVDDVVIWHNGEPTLLKFGNRVIVELSPENIYTLGRFAATEYCLHDLIATCDDDNLVRNWDQIKAAFDAAPDQIATALPPGHLRLDKGMHWGNAHEVLLGWGSIWDRRWWPPARDRYTQVHGFDQVLHRKADRLFSLLLNRSHTVIPADFEELPGARDGATALYAREDHTRLTKTARARALGILSSEGARGCTGRTISAT